MTCSVGDCTRPAARGGKCWAHLKQASRGQPTRPVAKRHESAWERLTEAAISFRDSDSLDDDGFERDTDRLRKAAYAYARQHVSERTREALARLRAEGVRIGRPRTIEPEATLRMVQELGGARKAAQALGVSVRTVRRALAQVRRSDRTDPFRHR